MNTVLVRNHFFIPPFSRAYRAALAGFSFVLSLILEDITYHAVIAVDKVMHLLPFCLYRFSGFG